MTNSNKTMRRTKHNLINLCLGITLALPSMASTQASKESVADPLAEAPTLNYIQTQDFVALDMKRGVYQVTLQVYKTTGTTISKIQSYLTDPWVAMSWDVSNIATNQWVKLTSEVSIFNDLTQSKLRFQASDHVSTGGGTGTVYVDDLTFAFLEEIPEEEEPVLDVTPKDLTIQVYPNPASTSMTVLMPESGSISLTSLDGRAIAQFEGVSELQYSTAHLQSGVYLLQIQINGTVAVKKIVIE